VLLSGKTLRHVLVIGVDGVRFDLLGPEVTPVIWGFGAGGFLGPVPVDDTGRGFVGQYGLLTPLRGAP
jgi:hypothetical protein